MTTDPRAALDRLVAALEAHLLAAGHRRGEADPAVVAAYQTLADAFETYDEALYTTYDEVTPFVLYDEAEDAADDDEIDEDDLAEEDPFDDQVDIDDEDDSDADDDDDSDDEDDPDEDDDADDVDETEDDGPLVEQDRNGSSEPVRA